MALEFFYLFKIIITIISIIVFIATAGTVFPKYQRFRVLSFLAACVALLSVYFLANDICDKFKFCTVPLPSFSQWLQIWGAEQEQGEVERLFQNWQKKEKEKQRQRNNDLTQKEQDQWEEEIRRRNEVKEIMQEIIKNK